MLKCSEPLQYLMENGAPADLFLGRNCMVGKSFTGSSKIFYRKRTFRFHYGCGSGFRHLDVYFWVLLFHTSSQVKFTFFLVAILVTINQKKSILFYGICSNQLTIQINLMKKFKIKPVLLSN